jgi:hypothetical protein
MLSDTQLNEIRNRQRSPSMVQKGTNYNADTEALIAEVSRLQEKTGLQDSERQELAELRVIKDKLVKFIWTCGIPLMPTAGG